MLLSSSLTDLYWRLFSDSLACNEVSA